jgi:hypothetical protein
MLVCSSGPMPVLGSGRCWFPASMPENAETNAGFRHRKVSITDAGFRQ